MDKFAKQLGNRDKKNVKKPNRKLYRRFDIPPPPPREVIKEVQVIKEVPVESPRLINEVKRLETIIETLEEDREFYKTTLGSQLDYNSQIEILKMNKEKKLKELESIIEAPRVKSAIQLQRRLSSTSVKKSPAKLKVERKDSTETFAEPKRKSQTQLIKEKIAKKTPSKIK